MPIGLNNIGWKMYMVNGGWDIIIFVLIVSSPWNIARFQLTLNRLSTGLRQKARPWKRLTRYSRARSIQTFRMWRRYARVKPTSTLQRWKISSTVSRLLQRWNELICSAWAYHFQVSNSRTPAADDNVNPKHPYLRVSLFVDSSASSDRTYQPSHNVIFHLRHTACTYPCEASHLLVPSRWL